MAMNSKILIAFAAGAVIASGIVFMAVRQEDAPRPVRVAVAQPKRVAPVPVPQTDAPAAAVQPPAAPPVAGAATPAPVREKPSPMPPPVRRERPVIVARNEKPQEPAPTPMPEPIT